MMRLSPIPSIAWWCMLALAALAGGGCGKTRAQSDAAATRATARSAVTDVPSRARVRAKPVAPGEKPGPGGPAFEYAYLAPKSAELQPVYTRARDADLLRQLPEVRAIDGMFRLPRRLRYVTTECGEFGAFYRPDTAEIALCYETLRALEARGEAKRRALGLGPDYPARYTRANVRFIVLHETGHALVALLDLPVTGRQEDAVDQLAAMLMLHFSGAGETPGQVMDDLGMAADQMLSHSTGAYDLDAYADEHALGEQRYFNLQCLIYGTDPVTYAGIVAAGDLTAARARLCPRETQAVGRAWLRLLLPSLAPKYEMTEDEAIRYFERKP